MKLDYSAVPTDGRTAGEYIQSVEDFLVYREGGFFLN